MRVAFLTFVVTLALAGCDEASAPRAGASSTDAPSNTTAAISQPAQPVAEARAAKNLQAAVPNLTNSMDQRDGQPKRYVLDVACPQGAAAAKCAAESATRASAWFLNHGQAPDELIMNVDLPSGGIGYQLLGPLPTQDELAHMSPTSALSRFSWNGGSVVGREAAAGYCLEDDSSPGFCHALADDACTPLATGDLERFCRSRN